ncbi:hypothetical protein [Actinokineospora inagensis]|uniref:hypothetical protein n=1 Tax=Actinokineospora inagensis TaxID=103730 RepID=UPI0003FF5648|nr:hypothetical protein [Actinokineospora inagensis]
MTNRAGTDVRALSWNSFRFVATLLSVVLLGIWVNILSEQLRDKDLWRSIEGLGAGNLFLVGGAVALVGSEYVTRRQRIVENERFERKMDLLRQRQQDLLRSTLTTVCELISKALEIPCNGRYFVAVHENGTTYLQQDRELAVLNIRMPREFGFTRLAVDTPHIVSGKSYRERRPLFEDLPVDHHTLYDTRVAQMIEPTQRWVLSCPVLTLDPRTNRHDESAQPHGVIVFYGVHDVPGADKNARVEFALDYAQQFAEQMSKILTMLVLTEEMVAGHDTQ